MEDGDPEAHFNGIEKKTADDAAKLPVYSGCYRCALNPSLGTTVSWR
jgi:hypothetical protein